MDSMAPISMFLVKAILVLDNEGERMIASYYSGDAFETPVAQRAFERGVFQKTHRSHAEIALYEDMTVVHRASHDVNFYVVGAKNENELILVDVLTSFFEACQIVLKDVVDNIAILENLAAVMLIVDELCDGGVILESDPAELAARALSKEDSVPLAEQSASQIFGSLRDKFTKRFNN